MEETELDDVIITLSYIYLLGASYLMQVMHRSARSLCLDKPDFTPENKHSFKRDLNFTSKAISYLTEAQRNYKCMMRNIDLIEQEMNGRLRKDRRAVLYDQQMSNMLNLLSVDMVYVYLTEERPETEEKIHDFLKTFKWTDELKKAYDLARSRSDRFYPSTSKEK